MRWRTLLLLLLAVAGLAWLALQRAEDTLRGVGATPERFALIPDLAPERVPWIRIDNLERASQLKLERDAAGRWYLTDPIAYPVDRSVVDLLLRTLEQARGESVGEAPDLEGLGLAPPRIVLTIGQRGATPEEPVRETRVEVGVVDLVGDLVHVRVPAHPGVASTGARALVLRSTRALYNTLDRNPDDFRERRATALEAPRIMGLERRGRVWLPEEESWVDLTLSARRDGPSWRRENEPTVGLDPHAIGFLVRAATELEVGGFQDDAPGTFAPYGLDPPLFSVELLDVEGQRATLEFGFPAEDGTHEHWPTVWYCRRAGFDSVWWIEDTDVQLLVRPAHEFYDYLLVRARREDVTRVELERGARRLVLERADTAGTGRRRGPAANDWEVHEVLDGVEGLRFRADAGAVQDLLPRLEATELVYPEADRRLPFVEGEAPASIAIHTADGRRWGGVIGAEGRDPASGAHGRHFRRFDDGLAGLVPESVAELLDRDVAALRSARIHRVRDVDVARVELARGEQRFTYVQTEPDDWVVRGQDFPAPRAFVDLTVHLFSLSAERWLEAEPAGLGESVEVVVTSAEGETLSFRLARGPEGELLCHESGRWSRVDVRSQTELWGHDLGVALRELFGS